MIALTKAKKTTAAVEAPEVAAFPYFAEPQTARLGDIFFAGPAIIFFGLKKGKLTGVDKSILVSTGIAMMIYNLHAYIQEDRRQRYLLEKK